MFLYGNGRRRFSQTFDAEAAGVERSALSRRDVDLQEQLLQRPAVGLRHILASGGNVRLWHKQAAQAHMDVLEKGKQKITSNSRFLP